MRKIIAVALVAALILNCPGLPCLEALAKGPVEASLVPAIEFGKAKTFSPGHSTDGLSLPSGVSPLALGLSPILDIDLSPSLVLPNGIETVGEENAIGNVSILGAKIPESSQSATQADIDSSGDLGVGSPSNTAINGLTETSQKPGHFSRSASRVLKMIRQAWLPRGTTNIDAAATADGENANSQHNGGAARPTTGLSGRSTGDNGNSEAGGNGGKLPPTPGGPPTGPDSGTPRSSEPNRASSVSWYLRAYIISTLGFELVYIPFTNFVGDKLGQDKMYWLSTAGLLGSIIAKHVANYLNAKGTDLKAAYTKVVAFGLGTSSFTLLWWILSNHYGASKAAMVAAIFVIFPLDSAFNGFTYSLQNPLLRRIVGGDETQFGQSISKVYQVTAFASILARKAGAVLAGLSLFWPLAIYAFSFIPTLYAFLFKIHVDQPTRTDDGPKVAKQPTTWSFSEAMWKAGALLVGTGIHVVRESPLIRNLAFATVAYYLVNIVLFNGLSNSFGLAVAALRGGGQAMSTNISANIVIAYLVGGMIGYKFSEQEGQLIEKSGVAQKAGNGSKSFRQRVSEGAFKWMDTAILRLYLSRWLQQAKGEDGLVSEKASQEIRYRSTVLWTRLGALSMLLYAAMFFPIPWLVYTAIAAASIIQAMAIAKLMTYLMTQARERDVQVSTFVIFSAQVIGALFLPVLGDFFKKIQPGNMTPVLYVSAALFIIALITLRSVKALKGHLGISSDQAPSKET